MASSLLIHRSSLRPEKLNCWGIVSETVQNIDDFANLRSEWSDFLERANIADPFLSHQWIQCFWQAFCDSATTLHVVVARRGQRLVGAAPLMLKRDWSYGLPLRVLCMIGNEHTPRADFILDESCPEAFDVMWDEIMGVSWDVLSLAPIFEASPTLNEVLRSARAFSLQTGTWNGSLSPYLRLRTGYEQYLETLPRKHRANIRNRRSRLERIGKVTVETVVSAAVAGSLEDVYRLEAAAWKGQIATSILSDRRRRVFYDELARQGSADGWLDLKFLCVGQRRIAAAYSLRYRGRYFLLKQGYDPDFSEFSPSTLLQDELVRQSFANGDDQFDFLGDDDAWKRRWADEARQHKWIFIFARSWRGRLAFYIKFRLLPALRGYRAYQVLRGAWIRMKNT